MSKSAGNTTSGGKKKPSFQIATTTAANASRSVLNSSKSTSSILRAPNSARVAFGSGVSPVPKIGATSPVSQGNSRSGSPPDEISQKYVVRPASFSGSKVISSKSEKPVKSLPIPCVSPSNSDPPLIAKRVSLDPSRSGNKSLSGILSPSQQRTSSGSPSHLSRSPTKFVTAVSVPTNALSPSFSSPSLLTPRVSPFPSSNFAPSSSISFTPNPHYIQQQSIKLHANSLANTVTQELASDGLSSRSYSESLNSARRHTPRTPRMIETGCQTQEGSTAAAITPVRAVSGLTRGLAIVKSENALQSEENRNRGKSDNSIQALGSMSSAELIKLFDSNYRDIMSQGYISENKNDNEEIPAIVESRSFDEFAEFRQQKFSSPKSALALQRVSGPDPLMMMKGNRQFTSEINVKSNEVQPLVDLINNMEMNSLPMYAPTAFSKAVPINKPKARPQSAESCASPQANGTSAFFDIPMGKQLAMKRIDSARIVVTPRLGASDSKSARASHSPSSSSNTSYASFMQSPRSAFVPASNSSRSNSSGGALASYRSALSIGI